MSAAMTSRPPTIGKRLRPQELLLPDGRKVVVALPEDIDAIRQKHADAHDGMQTEVVIHGSLEHHDYLRKSREHHESRREELREKHGPAFDEWDELHSQLNRVNSELERLNNPSSGLKQNFSKFGYAAELRTYDGNDGPNSGSSAASMTDVSSELTLSEDQPRPGETIKLFKRPVIKQWFHGGLLWRASEQTEIMAVELFFDLLYVGIIHTNGEHVAEAPNGAELHRFAVTFMMSWKIWTDVVHLMSWFETDDILSRLEILFEIACLLGFTTNMTYCFYEDPKHNTYTQLVAFYLAARVKNVFRYSANALLLPMVSGMMISQAVVALLPTALWIASIHVPMPSRFALIWPALILDQYGYGIIISMLRFSRSHMETSSLGKKIGELFTFMPALNIEHKVERTNAFVSLVLGYAVISVMFQSYGGYNFNAFLGKAVVGLIQAFIFNWMYFDIDGSNLHLHAIRRSIYTGSIWQFAHLPFAMGFSLASAALSKLVLVADVPNTNPEQLSHHYHELSEDHIPNGIRYFYCHGLAVALLSMTAIAISHDHRVPPTIRWNKNTRLANRVAVCIILFLLPLATSLRSLDLMGVTLGLTVWVLLFELWGTSCTNDPFIGEKKGCSVRYRARCAKADLEGGAKESGPKRMPTAEILELNRGDKTAVTGPE